MKLSNVMLATAVSLVVQGAAYAGVSAEEAKQLGANLTLFGAEKAGNKDGTIPEYTGGLPPNLSVPGFVPNSGKWPDPFTNEKPLFSITAQNMDQYADKLSGLQKEMLKRYPSYRLDIYPSHRTARYSKSQLDGMIKNATSARLTKNGLAIDGISSCIPFPIPKTGIELAWNQLLRSRGTFGMTYEYSNWYVDANGNAIHGSTADVLNRSVCLNPKGGPNDGTLVSGMLRNSFPARIAGDSLLLLDSLDTEASPRRAWSYSASTRRVRLAPDLAYDTPIATVGGVYVYDDNELFYGKLDRFDYKLTGKKEMYIPYNAYKFANAPAERIMTPKHANPDYVRWELHRVYVVEATLKPGFRHAYSKRIFYLDEDKTGAGMHDAFDSAGKLFRGMYMIPYQMWDLESQNTFSFVSYDLATGLYSLSSHLGNGKGFFPKPEGIPLSKFVADSLAGVSGR